MDGQKLRKFVKLCLLMRKIKLIRLLYQMLLLKYWQVNKKLNKELKIYHKILNKQHI
jgi:hypothetical protein